MGKTGRRGRPRRTPYRTNRVVSTTRWGASPYVLRTYGNSGTHRNSVQRTFGVEDAPERVVSTTRNEWSPLFRRQTCQQANDAEMEGHVGKRADDPRENVRVRPILQITEGHT